MPLAAGMAGLVMLALIPKTEREGSDAGETSTDESAMPHRVVPAR
jgi:hypothetical protein